MHVTSVVLVIHHLFVNQGAKSVTRGQGVDVEGNPLALVFWCHAGPMEFAHPSEFEQSNLGDKGVCVWCMCVA
jgi:hypothetical protein